MGNFQSCPVLVLTFGHGVFCLCPLKWKACIKKKRKMSCAVLTITNQIILAEPLSFTSTVLPKAYLFPCSQFLDLEKKEKHTV